MKKQIRMKRYQPRRKAKPRLFVFLVLLLAVAALVVLNLTGVLTFPFGGNTPSGTTASPGVSSSNPTDANATGNPSGSASPQSSETSTDTSSESPTASPAVSSSPSPTASPTPTPVVRAPGHENVPAYATLAPLGNIDTLKTKVETMIATFPGKYGVTFVNLTTGERFGIQDTDEYIAASTSKFPMNILLWKRIAAGEIDPESMLSYQQEDLEYGTGIIQNEPYGTEFTVRETSRLSIIYSDNCGINTIIRLLDIEDIRQYIRDQGGVVEYGKRHRSCPSDMANCAVDLHKFYYEDPEIAGELIEYLENTKWNDRINGLLPDVKVAHKIGNQTRTANDVGIVFATQPYVLSIMTDNVDFDAACKNIAKLSKMIYDEMEAAQQP